MLCPTIEVYILVSQDEQHLEVYQRSMGWKQERFSAGQTAKLEQLKLELPVETIYEGGVTFPLIWLIRILAGERCDRMKSDEPSTVGIDRKGRIHYARGCAVAACHLAKLLRHHRLRFSDADWFDVRGDHVDRAGTEASDVDEWGMGVFSTQNIVHFGEALLIAAILVAPWQALWPVGLLLGLAGLVGVIYLTLEDSQRENKSRD